MVVRLRNLQKTYKTGTRKKAQANPVFTNVNLDIEKGDFLVVMGRSGAGKTSLLNILGGLDTEYDGDVIILGKSLKSLSESGLSNLRNRHIGFVFQAFHLVNTFTCLENVVLPAFFGGITMDRARKRGMELLAKMGLQQKADTLPFALSAGERQRVAIARAMLNDPEILLCDEPTGNLDPETGNRVIDIFKDLSSQGKSVVMVTHNPGISAWASHTVHIVDGTIKEMD